MLGRSSRQWPNRLNKPPGFSGFVALDKSGFLQGINTGVSIHNLESSPGLVRCELMREGVLRDAVSIPLEANGQTSWLIDAASPPPIRPTSWGRCDAVEEALFTAVALEMDPGTRTFITLPVLPVPEIPSRK